MWEGTEGGGRLLLVSGVTSVGPGTTRRGPWGDCRKDDEAGSESKSGPEERPGVWSRKRTRHKKRTESLDVPTRTNPGDKGSKHTSELVSLEGDGVLVECGEVKRSFVNKVGHHTMYK